MLLKLEQIYLLTLYHDPNQLSVYHGLKLMKFQTEVLVKNTSESVCVCVCFVWLEGEKEDGEEDSSF